ncbi:hypothetical protein Ctob_002618 [Chrysochromulina tobinii]|uniref:EF-hand domain-containing protein n=1 Tax=Chrysochromulina tobinii TaxID=1460289 RepID=A0A0M0JMX7_9EUKA|nr:hypothetical protein Ctob_002618 [Chrysochromulina tobinii]|eukprot:KOO27598.1 hypothetical protein Ctob_002618 [Chrysochromulina sp. CCMP291]
MPQFPTAAAMPVQRPAARLDAFDADNTETFVDERSPVVDETVNEYLRREGLGGAALCDLRRFLQEVEASVTSCSDVELGGLDDALTYGETFIRVGGRSTSTFEDKARKLSEKHAVMRKVSTAESDAELRLEKAMKQHVIKGDAAEMGAYFNRCVDRARSAETHNVFDRFADWELEQLVLVFGRFDSDLDGVLEFPDFCRIALMVCERVGAAYLEHDLRRMFHKIDLDGDKRIDLNEFLWMQVPAEKLAKVHSRP